MTTTPNPDPGAWPGRLEGEQPGEDNPVNVRSDDEVVALEVHDLGGEGGEDVYPTYHIPGPGGG